MRNNRLKKEKNKGETSNEEKHNHNRRLHFRKKSYAKTFDDVASAKQYLYDTGMTDEDIANEGIAFVPGEEVDGEDQENYVSVPFPFSFEKETIDEELWNAPITTEEAKAKVHQYLASAGMEAMN